MKCGRNIGGISADIFNNNPDNAKEIASDDLIIQYDTGRISPEQFHGAITDKYGLNIDFAEFVELWCGVFSPIPGMDKLLRELNGRVVLGLLSDTDPLHWNYLLKEYSVLNIIENPTLSYKIGVMKPSAAIYLAAARNIDTPPKDCLYVDDLAANVEGARLVGMNAIQFEGTALLREKLIRRGIL